MQDLVRVGSPQPGSTARTDALIARLEAEIAAEQLEAERRAAGD
jgi:hypothetical protein